MSSKVAVVIPCYKCKSQILSVIKQIGTEVHNIYVVDDCCPETTGSYVKEKCQDTRVKVIFHKQNKGVGGAVISGYNHALLEEASIIIKLDGDGQMDPLLIHKFIKPIKNGTADYVKGNRFFDLDSLIKMPKTRLFGNAMLSFINKVSSGYWYIMDPTNGYTAIHSSVLKLIPLHKVAERYFFESDMLFRLSTIRAVIYDLPMKTTYGDEISNLRISKVIIDFPPRYIKCFFKRILYSYFLRDFNIGSVYLILSILLIVAGSSYGIFNWVLSINRDIPATSGTVMLAALPVILGFQSMLAAINYDMANVPKTPIHKILED